MTQNLVKNAWLDVGSELEAIGLKLKLHLEQASSAQDDDDDDDDDDDVDDDDVDRVVRQLADKIEIAIDAMESAADDTAVHSDLRDVGGKLVAAVSTTFREATRATQRQMNQ